MHDSDVPKMRVSGSSSYLLLASLWEQLLENCYLYIFFGFVGNGLHTDWVCEPGVCSSKGRSFAKFFSETTKQIN